MNFSGAPNVMMHAAFRKARLTTLALSAAAFIAISASALELEAERPALDVPFVPTPPEVVERMMQMADVGPGDFVIDLGSGDGRIAVAAAKLGAQAIGVDIDPERIQEAQENARWAGVRDKVSFNCQSLFKTRIGEATVLTMYLRTKVNLDLRPRLLKELKPGTRIVSHAFDMGDWKPDSQSEIGQRQVYMWIVPAQAAGHWRVQNGAETFSLALEQEYQYLKGSARIDGRTVEVSEGRLHGTEIRLTLADGRKFQGRVNGDRMEPLSACASDKAATNWHATRTS